VTNVVKITGGNRALRDEITLFKRTPMKDQSNLEFLWSLVLIVNHLDFTLGSKSKEALQSTNLMG
jgi:hypothetical protein